MYHRDICNLRLIYTLILFPLTNDVCMFFFFLPLSLMVIALTAVWAKGDDLLCECLRHRWVRATLYQHILIKKYY